jgi:hypothetical protein
MELFKNSIVLEMSTIFKQLQSLLIEKGGGTCP